LIGGNRSTNALLELRQRAPQARPAKAAVGQLHIKQLANPRLLSVFSWIGAAVSRRLLIDPKLISPKKSIASFPVGAGKTS
jgi:hypothetical protein